MYICIFACPAFPSHSLIHPIAQLLANCCCSSFASPPPPHFICKCLTLREKNKRRRRRRIGRTTVISNFLRDKFADGRRENPSFVADRNDLEQFWRFSAGRRQQQSFHDVISGPLSFAAAGCWKKQHMYLFYLYAHLCRVWVEQSAEVRTEFGTNSDSGFIPKIPPHPDPCLPGLA